MSATRIREFEEQDIQPAVDLTNEVIRHTAIHFSYEPDTIDAWQKAFNERAARFPWLAAEVDNKFAGFAKASPWRDRTAYQGTVETSIYLTEDARGQGVGKVLYTHLLKLLKEQGFHAVVAGMTLPNHASARLHESLGFARVGVFREVGRKFEQWHDVQWMQLLL